MRYITAGIFILVSAIIFSGCRNSSSKEINKTVDSFFGGYKGNFREANPDLLSNELNSTIKKVVDFEKQSAAYIKNSDHPTDKPHLMEGDLFVSLYEGYTGFRVMEINQNGNEAIATIYFTNSNYQISWTDDVVLINEGGWKIDDVNYRDPSKKNLTLRLVMDEFLKFPLN